MRWTAPIIVILALGMLSIPASSLSVFDGAPARADEVDIKPVINIPLPGGKMEAELGLRVNVTLMNLGSTNASSNGTLTMTIKNNINGQVVYNPFAITYTNITSGGSRDILFGNWTTAKPGTYQVEVYSIYPGDTNASNNKATVDFSLFSTNWTQDPKFESYSLDPPKGNTSTVFVYKVEYVFNKLPDVIQVEIDGVNHTMIEETSLDDVPEDGKFYIYTTTMPPGNHVFRFFGEVDDEVIDIPSKGNLSSGPWVNLTLRNPLMNPMSGYVTSLFNLKVNYGSTKDLPPDEIYAMVGEKRVNLTQFSPSAIYTSGNVEFSAQALGMDILPSPISVTFHCSVDGDEISLGPFDADGPSMEKTVMSGKVRDTAGNPIEGAAVKLIPGPTVTTDGEGSYTMHTYIGRSYSLICTKEGFYNKTYTGSIDLYDGEVRKIDIEMAPLPRRLDVSGWVSGSFNGKLVKLAGASVRLSGPDYNNTITTDSTGFYLFEKVPPSGLHVINFTAPNHRSREKEVMIREGDDIAMNITLFELSMEIHPVPDPEDGEIPVDSSFTISFPSPVNISTLDIELVHIAKAEQVLDTTIVMDSNMTMVTIHPKKMLMFDSKYVLVLQPGVLSSGSDLLVWREITWSYVTGQQDLGDIETTPLPDSYDVPIDTKIEITFGIGVNMSTFDYSLMVRDPVETPVDSVLDYDLLVDMNDSGRARTIIEIVPSEPLTFGKSHILIVNDTLMDIYGRSILTGELILEFLTESEPDTDGDGVLNSQDAYPDDPSVSMDTDGDGYPDGWMGDHNHSEIDPSLSIDAFPADASAWNDTDGDGKPDLILGVSTTGLVQDDDSDGDGMPDDWEVLHGLDPYDNNDAYIDSDGDGKFNVDEYVDDTDPRDSSSVIDDGSGNSYLILTVAIIIILVVIAGAIIFFVLKGRSSSLDHEE